MVNTKKRLLEVIAERDDLAMDFDEAQHEIELLRLVQNFLWLQLAAAKADEKELRAALSTVTRRRWPLGA